MKRVIKTTAAYCPPESHVLWPTLTAGFLQGSNSVQPVDMESYNDLGDDDNNWN